MWSGELDEAEGGESAEEVRDRVHRDSQLITQICG
jgi:hypothetical protein